MYIYIYNDLDSGKRCWPAPSRSAVDATVGALRSEPQVTQVRFSARFDWSGLLYWVFKSSKVTTGSSQTKHPADHCSKALPKLTGVLWHVVTELLTTGFTFRDIGWLLMAPDYESRGKQAIVKRFEGSPLPLLVTLALKSDWTCDAQTEVWKGQSFPAISWSEFSGNPPRLRMPWSLSGWTRSKVLQRKHAIVIDSNTDLIVYHCRFL